MEHSVQVGHDLQHLGSGRIAISLAKSMNQQRLATSYQGDHNPDCFHRSLLHKSSPSQASPVSQIL